MLNTGNKTTKVIACSLLTYRFVTTTLTIKIAYDTVIANLGSIVHLTRGALE